MVLSAVSRAAATSGPVRKRWHCKVHNGLRVLTCPPARHAIACTVAQGHAVDRKAVMNVDCYAVACGVQRNGSPDRQTLCRITDSLRAKATLALPAPERRSIAAAQSFRCSGRLTR